MIHRSRGFRVQLRSSGVRAGAGLASGSVSAEGGCRILSKLLFCHYLEYGARIEDYMDEDDLSVLYLEPSSGKERYIRGGEIVEDCHFVPFGYDLSNSKLKQSMLDFGERVVCTLVRAEDTDVPHIILKKCSGCRKVFSVDSFKKAGDDISSCF
jgi:hypothetical protein